MTWWIVGGVVALGVLLFVVMLVSVAGHLRPLGRAVRRLRLRQEQAEVLQGKLEIVSGQLMELQQSVEQATAKSEQVKAGRTGSAQ